jgi:hypothetical protein
MRVRCVADRLGEWRFGVEVGAEYVVLALEAKATAGKWLPAGLHLFVGDRFSHRCVPIACVEIIDPRISAKWQIGQVGERWLIGYPLMLDLNFQIGLERGDDPGFAAMYQDLLSEARAEMGDA